MQYQGKIVHRFPLIGVITMKWCNGHDLICPIRSAWTIFTHLIPPMLILLFPFGNLKAGEYHSLHNGTLYCDECHTISPSEKAGAGSKPSRRAADDKSKSYPHLLKSAGNKVCTECHDNTMGVSDVVGANMGCSPEIVRQAGALTMVGGNSPYREEFGHTLGLVAPAPGSQPTWIPPDGLLCIDCHDPHGYNPNGNAYRNLTAFPGNTTPPGVIVTYSVEIIDPSRDVFVRSPIDYDISSVDFNEPLPHYSAMADFCRGCHSDFHDQKRNREMGETVGTGWVKHPSGDADIGRIGVHHSSRNVFAGNSIKDNYVKVMTGTGNWTPHSDQEVADHSPTCITCHKAHGNMNPFGLICMANTGPVTEEGTPGGKYTDLCRQCHLQSYPNSQLTRR